MAYNRKDGRIRRKRPTAARSIYKLEAIDERFKLIRRGDRALDLGCAPGSWLQYLDKAAGAQGEVVGIDLKTVRLWFRRVRRPRIKKTPLEVLSPKGHHHERDRLGHGAQHQRSAQPRPGALSAAHDGRL